MANDLGRDECEQEGETSEKYVPLTQDGLQELEDNSICKPTVTAMKTTSKGKKMKSVDVDLSNLVDTLGDFMKQSKDSMGDLSKDIGKGSGQSNVSKQITEIMKGVVGLKVSDKLKVCDELVQNPNRLDLFLNLPPDEQIEYVWMLLDEFDRITVIMWIMNSVRDYVAA
ncbi:hypothetical protein ACS0TY_014872 [Phlomoides rotata]